MASEFKAERVLNNFGRDVRKETFTAEDAGDEGIWFLATEGDAGGRGARHNSAVMTMDRETALEFHAWLSGVLYGA